MIEERNQTKPTKQDMLYYSNYPGIAYVPKDGYICRVDSDKEFIRKLIPDINLMLNIFVKEKNSFTNRKAINLSYEILHSKPVPEGYLVYPKDADPENLRANNLGLMSKADHIKYKDAIDNIINDKLKMQYSQGKYKVRYKEAGRTKTKKFDDVITATVFKKQVYLDSARLLAKFYIN